MMDPSTTEMDGDSARRQAGFTADTPDSSASDKVSDGVSPTSSYQRKALRREFVIVALLFLLSGLSSLIYQVIWTRMLVFVFGSSTFATSTVLSVFMGGLALGSFVAGRYSDRMKNTFLWYGVLEGVIGIWALLAPFMFDAAIPIYKAIWQSTHMSVVPFSLLRFLVAAIILLPPTACMGATLPLLSRFVTTSLDVVGDRVGTLYAINTFGAVVGAVCAGFFLMPAFGISTTTSIAAGINILLAVAVYLLARRWAQKAPPPVETGGEGSLNKSEKLPLPVLVTMVSFAASGAIALIYEVGWTRTLLMVIGSTTYAFSIMLSTFLIGIFLGSFICARFVDRLKEPVIWFGLMEICLCFAGLASMVCFNYLPYLNIMVNQRIVDNPDAGMVCRFLFSGLVLVPITMCLGAIFPIAVKACTQDLSRVGRSVGTLYSLNTLGAIVGAFAAGFVVIPILGTERTLILASVANLILGMAIIIPFAKLRPLIRVFAILTTGAVSVWALQQPALWDRLVILSSQKERRALSFRGAGVQVPPYAEWRNLLHDAFDIVFWEDGLCAHVAVLKLRSGKYSMLTSGHLDASDDLDMINQAMPPCYALLLKPGSKDVCVIGWGSGVMNGYALQFPIEKMVSVEIESEVIPASKFFHHVNRKPELDPRCQLEFNDGRNYLLATDEKFDVISSQPSNPWQAGVCNLFTQDSFQVCKDALKPDGIFAMWFQQAEVSHENLVRVLAALKKAFSHVMIFELHENDVCALASNRSMMINIEEVNESFKNPKVAGALARFGIDDALDVIAKLEMAPLEVDSVTRGVEPNSDNMNYLEYNVSRTYEQKHFIFENREWMDKHSGPIWNCVDWGDASPRDKALLMAKIGERALNFRVKRGMLWAEESIKVQDNPHAHAVLGLGFAELGDYIKAVKEMNTAVAMAPEQDEYLQGRALVELKAGAVSLARADLERLLTRDKHNPLTRYRLAQTYSDAVTEDRFKQAIVPMEEPSTLKADPRKVLSLCADLTSDARFVAKRPGVLFIVGEAYHELGRDREALPLLDRYLKLMPHDLWAWRITASVLHELNDETESAWCLQQSLSLGGDLTRRLLNKAEALIKEGHTNDALIVIRKAMQILPTTVRGRELLAELVRMNVAGAEATLAGLARFNADDAKLLGRLRSGESPD